MIKSHHHHQLNNPIAWEQPPYRLEHEKRTNHNFPSIFENGYDIFDLTLSVGKIMNFNVIAK
jgi:hypothetical protein